MKRFGNLKKYWCNYDALMQGWEEVKKGKTFNPHLLKYEANLVTNLTSLLDRLESNTYVPRKPREFYIYEPKKRLIHAPQLEDRIVHHALLHVIRDKIEHRFIYHTFACQKGKGTHKASDILMRWLIQYRGVGHCLKIDISKFFYSIDHNKLEQQIRRILKCDYSVELLKQFYINDDGKGLPLGNVTSQVLANLVLNPVDHLIKRNLKIKHYIRYMDDLVLLHKDKSVLQNALNKIIILLSNMKFRINSKTCIRRINDGVDFVGYKTWFNRRIIRKRSLYNIKRKLKKGICSQRVSSFLSHAKRTDSIVYVAQKILEITNEYNDFITIWIKHNREDKFNAIFQS
jgi:hypothetical protein